MAASSDVHKDCPFPEVAESLRPFIKTRQEVDEIRRAHHASLALSSVELLQPDVGDRIDPSGLNGARKAYWRALLAHRAAQSRYDALKAELSQMVHNPPSSNGTIEDDSSFLAENYVPLMQQREKHRKLKVVESTYLKITASGDAIGESLDKTIKRRIGELPAPPSTTSLSDREPGSSTEYDLTQLKRAILSAKQRLEDNRRRSKSVNGIGGGSDSRSELRALQKTHNELTTWMETQLSLISEVDSSSKEGSEDSKSLKSLSESSGAVSHSTEDINSLYEQYLEARQRLLDTVATAPGIALDSANSRDHQRRASEALDAQQRASGSEILLPYLPDLISAKQREQSLLQQSAHSRRQIASAEAHTKAVLTRLADESHLVQPELSRGSPRGRDWAKAASEASSATITAASQRIKAGQASADAARDSLEKIKSMPSSMDSTLK
ncbi:Hypothetical predicted protein [Lecanosticta acicola]|uniref:Uncharacterized protein n=1 Tax=Lecanosticta acicola TaxID=111012 RepID=A0AAI8Z6K1_9PEZI|nr:Hypothetical predicted protein [Lecanosticta acicola]